MMEKNGQSKQIFQKVRQLHCGDCPKPKRDENSKPFLTSKEFLVLQLIAEGLSNPKIGLKLSISPKTVDTHRQNIMKKLDVHSAPELIKKALIKGLLI